MFLVFILIFIFLQEPVKKRVDQIFKHVLQSEKNLRRPRPHHVIFAIQLCAVQTIIFLFKIAAPSLRMHLSICRVCFFDNLPDLKIFIVFFVCLFVCFFWVCLCVCKQKIAKRNKHQSESGRPYL